tara:strand:+ start:495 stop:1154 length:660 start_codon:yes stop_codon:yes gene_type:complete
MKKSHYALIPVVVILILGYQDIKAHGAGCSEMPFSPGETVLEMTPSGLKIFATGASEVDFDDVEDVLEATREASMRAKVAISKFFREDIQSIETVDKAIETRKIKIKNTSGVSEEVAKVKIKRSMSSMINNTSALLRGVIKLAECYDKGKKVMVTVGLKPETIKAAESGSKAISDSLHRQPNTQSNSQGSKSDLTSDTDNKGSNGPKSYMRGLHKLKKF